MDRIPLLLQAIESDPENATYRFMVATEYWNARRFEEALQWLSSYVERGQDTGAAYRMMAACHLELGSPERAADAYREGIARARAAGHPTMAEEFEEKLAELDRR